MLSDLNQYFTQIDINMLSGIDDFDIVRFLSYVYKHTFYDSFKNGIAYDVIDHPDGFYEAYEVFASSIFDGDFHLQDALIHVPVSDNAFLELLFSTVLPPDMAKLYFDDSDLSYIIERYNKPFSINRKIDKYMNNFIDERISLYTNEDGTIDEYSAELTRFISLYIDFKNKSFARKFRKAYMNNDLIREVFNDFNMYMENGCFIILLSYNAEGYYSEGVEMLDVFKTIKGFEALRHELNLDNFNQIERALSIAFQKLNYNLYQDTSPSNEYNSFITSLVANISRLIDPPEGETIL